MTLYIKKEFNLGDFEAWSGGADRLKEIIELDIVEDAQYYIESIFEDEQAVTETDINDMLWFEMGGFIEEYLTERAEEILDTMLSEALESGTLYELVTSDTEMQLVAKVDKWAEELDWYGYYDLDEDTVYIEDDKLYVVNNEDTTVSSYMVDLSTGRVLLDDMVEL